MSSDTVAEAQRDEMESMVAIFADDFTHLSSSPSISYSIKLHVMMDDVDLCVVMV